METDFSAKEPSLGYFYQIKYALFMLMCNVDELDNPKIQIECLDDIEIGSLDSLHLLQTKYHIKSKANLTDASVDFWKTIRIWSEHISNELIDIDQTIFNLITTASISESSKLYKFKEGIHSDLELTHLIDELDQICINSTNSTNTSSYQAYQKLSQENKRKLIKNIRIIDNSIDIDGIDDKIKRKLILSTYPSTIEAFLEILEGWWIRKAIDNLSGKNNGIELNELSLKISNIRDTFHTDNLPNHFPEQLEITDEDAEDLKDKTFLKQLELIKISTNSKIAKRAISDFRRAYEQRSKWLRLDLLNPEEEEKYDERLYDYWKNIFDIMSDEAENEGIDKFGLFGKNFYLEQFAKICPQIKIRERFKEDYLTRGSYHMLADLQRIGWHPKYKNEL